MRKSSKIILAVLAMLCFFAINTMAYAADNVTLQLDGENVTLKHDAINKDGRVYMPLRDVFETMGATVKWDQATNLVQATRGNVNMKFTLGDDKMYTTVDGITQTNMVSVLPFVKDGHTYVPVRFIAQGMNCKVGWDSDAKTVVVVDTEQLLKQYKNGQYTMAQKALDFMQSQNKGGYELSGTLSLFIAVDDRGKIVPIAAEMSMDSVTDRNLNMELAATIDLDLRAFYDAFVNDEDTELLYSILGIEEQMKLDINYLYDLQKGIIYYQFPFLNQLMSYEDNTWLKIDMNEFLADTGLSWSDLLDMSKNLAVDDIFDLIVESFSYGDVEAYDALDECLSIISDLLSDESFQEGNIAEYGLTQGKVYTSAMNYDDILAAIALHLVNDQPAAVILYFDLEMEENEELELFYEVTQSKCYMDGKLLTDGLNALITYDANIAPTTKTVNPTPQGTIVDINDL